MKGASHLEILSKNVSIVPKGQIIFTQQTFSVAGRFAQPPHFFFHQYRSFPSLWVLQAHLQRGPSSIVSFPFDA